EPVAEDRSVMTEKRQILVANDDYVREEVLSISAAVGSEIEHVPDVVAAAETWTSAPIVLVDTEALTSHESSGPRRSETVLVCYGNPAGEIWERAFTSGIRRGKIGRASCRESVEIENIGG